MNKTEKLKKIYTPHEGTKGTSPSLKENLQLETKNNLTYRIFLF